MQRRLEQGWHTRIEWVPEQTGIDENEMADQLAGEAALEKRKGRTSTAWLKERIPQHFTMAKDSEIDKGKESITPAPKKLRTASQGHCTDSDWALAVCTICPLSNQLMASPTLISLRAGLMKLAIFPSYHLCLGGPKCLCVHLLD
jgi:hypothetical protein